MTKVDTMEQTLSAMQQQMRAFFGRWEQEKSEQEGERARRLEIARGKAPQEEGAPIAEEQTSTTKDAGQVLLQAPISAPGEGSEQKGSFSRETYHTERDYGFGDQSLSRA